jgi:hypothetical protein
MRGKESPQLKLYVLMRLGLAIREEGDKPGNAEISPHMRSWLTKLNEVDRQTQDQQVDTCKNAAR